MKIAFSGSSLQLNLTDHTQSWSVFISSIIAHFPILQMLFIPVFSKLCKNPYKSTTMAEKHLFSEMHIHLNRHASGQNDYAAQKHSQNGPMSGLLTKTSPGDFWLIMTTLLVIHSATTTAVDMIGRQPLKRHRIFISDFKLAKV